MGAAIGGLGAATALAATRTARPGLNTLATTPVAVQQEVASSQVRRCMNRYETLLSMGYIQRALAEFALSQPDVQADVGFGLYYGPDSVKKLFIDVHGMMLGDADKKTLKNGATYLLANTTDIIEVAEDLKTAKGLWLCPTLSTPGDEKQGFSARTGYAHRVADFVNENGKWKLWHYMVYGLTGAPAGKSWTDPEVVAANQVNRYGWIPDHLKPDRPQAPGIGAAGGWRPDRPVTEVQVPAPYRTFAETFSYGFKL